MAVIWIFNWPYKKKKKSIGIVWWEAQKNGKKPRGGDPVWSSGFLPSVYQATALDPRQAASLAADENVAVYTIGAGAEGKVPMPIYDYAGNRVGTEMRSSEIDTLLLRDIAEGTGGLFFRAIDEGAVQQAFELISQDAKVEFDAPPPLISHERFYLPVIAGLILLAVAIIGILRRQIGITASLE